MSNDCTEERRERKPMKCHNCQQEGHRAQDCTNEAVERLDEEGNPLPAAVTYIPKADTVDDAAYDQLAYTDANLNRFEGIQVTVSDDMFTTPLGSFEEAGLGEDLMSKVVKMKYHQPTPIQKYCMPIIMAGKDLIACSQTGSGKSAAFILPIVNQLLNGETEFQPQEAIRGQRTQEPLVLVLSPTRELCVQLYQHFRLFSEESPRRLGCSTAYGGTQVMYNRNAIRSGTHVLCAVPGRLKQFVDEGTVSFAKLRYLVLDEADRMLDDGFQTAIQEFAEHPSMPAKESRQTLMFSATFQSDVEQLARTMMRPQETVKVVVGILGSVNADVTQSFVECADLKAKREMLLQILNEMPGCKLSDVAADAGQGDESHRPKVIVFVEQKKNADVLAIFLSQHEFSTTSIHGNRDQSQREDALRTFRTGKHAVLVATEVAARGLDIKGVGHVINFDLPKDIDKFVHRVGRTGRVGVPGNAISFFDPSRDSELAPHLVKVLNECEQPVPEFISNAAAGGGDFGGGDDGWNEGGAGGDDENTGGW